MAQTFNCPSCNASLDYDGEDAPIVRCAFCNSAVILPENIRTRPLPNNQVTNYDKSFKLDLSDLNNQVLTLKTIKELIHEGRNAEARRLYQKKFDVSEIEAEAFINRLASGQSVDASHVLSLNLQRQAFINTLPTANRTVSSFGKEPLSIHPRTNVRPRRKILVPKEDPKHTVTLLMVLLLFGCWSFLCAFVFFQLMR